MKRKLNPEQLVKDGFVQLKSLRQLQKQGILPKILTNDPRVLTSFENVKYNPGLNVAMIPHLGKIVHLYGNRIEPRGTFMDAEDCWTWPIECILR